jgi:hypothetical protein
MPGLVALPNAERRPHALLVQATGRRGKEGKRSLAVAGSIGPRETERNGAASFWQRSIRAPKWRPLARRPQTLRPSIAAGGVSEVALSLCFAARRMRRARLHRRFAADAGLASPSASSLAARRRR